MSTIALPQTVQIASATTTDRVFVSGDVTYVVYIVTTRTVTTEV